MDSSYDTGGKIEHLFSAIRSGDIAKVETCLMNGSSVEACGPDGSRPLVLAAKKGHEEIVDMLLKAGADPNQISLEGKAWTALHWAAALGNEAILYKMLMAGCDPLLGTKSGKNAADLARMQGYPKLVRILEGHIANMQSSNMLSDSLMNLLDPGSGNSLLQPMAGMTLRSPGTSPISSPMAQSRQRHSPYLSPAVEGRGRRVSSPVMLQNYATERKSMENIAIRPRQDTMSMRPQVMRRTTIHEMQMPSFSFDFMDGAGPAAAMNSGPDARHVPSLHSLASPVHSPLLSPAHLTATNSAPMFRQHSLSGQSFPSLDQNIAFFGYDSLENVSGNTGPPRSCAECGATQTPQWRRAVDGSSFLCNSCGLKQKYRLKKQEKQERQEKVEREAQANGHLTSGEGELATAEVPSMAPPQE